VKYVNNKLARKVVEMERQAKHQELRWKSVMERVRIQEHIIEELGKKIQEQNLAQAGAEPDGKHHLRLYKIKENKFSKFISIINK
jgi:hypothetical protein